MNMTSKQIAETVDALGAIKAQIAPLAEHERALKDKLIVLGVGSYDGQLFAASVSIIEREKLDLDACRAKLSPQFLAAHTSTTISPMVRVSARKSAPVAFERAA